MTWTVLATVVPPVIVFALALWATLRGVLGMPGLRAVRVDARETWPRVSMVVPACDEEGSVEASLRSALRLRYPDLEIVAIDDRSHDQTGEILDRLASAEPRLRALHVEDLPDGWLGKLNALARGVADSRGDWLLFADADVHLGPDSLKKAITYADAHAVDFLSVLPEIGSAGFLGDCVFNLVVAFFCVGARPWAIRDASSRAIGATGAFMLVRRTAFDKTPGFEWLKLEVADDFGLCLMIKSFGGTCDLVNGRGEVSLDWYASFREMTLKMQKNFFAITGRFSLRRMVFQALVVVWLALFPLVLLASRVTWVPTWVALASLLLLTNTVIAAAWTGRPILPSFAAPLGLLLTAYMLIRAGVAGHRSGGITWRGVLYPTKLLKGRQRVRV